MGDTSIEWATKVWNPVTGCDKVSPGCKHCYAAEIAHRFWKGRAFEDVQTHPDRLAIPLKWKQPEVVFVNSMSDLFHEAVPNEFIAAVFGVMAATPRHRYVILTKRIERAVKFMRWLETDLEGRHKAPALAHHAGCIAGFRSDYASEPDQSTERHLEPGDKIQRAANELPYLWVHTWPLANVWIGPSAEDDEWLTKRWSGLVELKKLGWNTVVSAEPLLGPIELPVNGDAHCIDWLIAGGESGHKSRVRGCDLDWQRSLRDQCRENQIPFLEKQLGSRPLTDSAAWEEGLPAFRKVLKHKKGSNPDEWPEDMRVFQAPAPIARILNAQKNATRKFEVIERKTQTSGQAA